MRKPLCIESAAFIDVYGASEIVRLLLK
jgi:hypothetical protein